MIVGIDHQQFFDPPLMQQPPRVVLSYARRYRRQIFMSHQLRNRLVRLFGKTYVAVGKYPRQPSVGLDYRNARNRVVRHDRPRLGQRRFRADRDRVDHHPAFEALHLAHCGALFLDRQIAVEHTNAAQLRHDNRHPRLGDGIHRRRQHGNVERNRLGQPGACVGLTGQYPGLGGLQQHVVEGQSEGNVNHRATVPASVDSWRPM